MPEQELSVKARIGTIAAVAALFVSIGLYVREFPVFYNTINVQYLLTGAAISGLVIAGAILYFFRARFTPFGRHVPEVLLVGVTLVLFAPLFASLLNRGLGRMENQSFEFMDETPFSTTGGFGLWRTNQIKRSGFSLEVRENGNLLRFRYKKQRYFPITRPGEFVLLPVCQGLFGIRVVRLE
jgi:hypothetical protein